MCPDVSRFLTLIVKSLSNLDLTTVVQMHELMLCAVNKFCQKQFRAFNFARNINFSRLKSVSLVKFDFQCYSKTFKN